jgi:hypothetical protein
MNIAARLACRGDVAVLDCDLWGAGPRSLVAQSGASARYGLGAVLQAGVSLAPAALLEEAVSFEVDLGRDSRAATPAGNVSVLGGACSLDGADREYAGPWSLGLEAGREIAARCEEILTLLNEWVAVPATPRWVLIDVPAHPTVAPAILEAICSFAAARSPDDRLSVPDPVVLGCFDDRQRHRWQLDELARRLNAMDNLTFRPFCTREAKGPAGAAAIHALVDWLRALPT